MTAERIRNTLEAIWNNDWSSEQTLKAIESLANQFDYLEKFLDKLKNGISTADQLPQDGEQVIIWGPSCNDNGKPFAGVLENNKWWDESDLCEGFPFEDITRWWPLPDAPKED